MRIQRNAVFELDLVPDDRKRADGDVRTEACSVLNDGTWMDEGHCYSCSDAIIALTTASAARCSPTLTSPAYFHKAPRWRSFFTWYSTTSPGTTGRRNLHWSMVRK